MRLSRWRASPPAAASVAAPVVALLERVLRAMGAGDDPWCWIAWGDDPASRWSVLVPLPEGLVVGIVRVEVPGEGPRISAKLVRWPRVQLGELGLETSQGRLLLSVQVEGHVLRGVDDEAVAISRFARVLVAAADGRPWPSLDEPPAPKPSRSRRAIAAPA